MTISNKFFRIGLIAAALMIPLAIVNFLVWDRSTTGAEVRGQVTDGWSSDQIVTSPMLVVPFTRPETRTVVENGKTSVVSSNERDALIIAPDSLRVDARLQPQVRRRSLFDVLLYNADVSFSADFSIDPSTDLSEGGVVLDWSHAYVALRVADNRGLGGSVPTFIIDGHKVEARPGGRDLPNAQGLLSAPAGLDAKPADSFRVTTDLPIKGSTTFAIAGNARRVALSIRSAWPHPSFIGGLLPDVRKVSAKGFAARWSTTYLALNRPLVENASTATPTDKSVIAGVALVEPVDLYAQVSRAVKYGALFIALTFLTFFVFDATGQRPVPMLAYALVGLGLVLFYLLLLALAEYISLLPAYLTAASALIGLISAYSKAVLRSIRRAGIIAGVLSALYGVLYVLLQLEDFALLLGSIALFIALAVLMYVTRDVAVAED